MNKNTIILSAFWTALVLMFFASCTEDMEGTFGLYDGPVPLAINASINGGTGRTSTRANVADKEDMWSYSKEFTHGDVMGFYSSGGNWEKDGGTGSFENQPLQYDAERNQFVDPQDGVNFSPTHMKASEIFMYYPYDENMKDPGPGMELRTIAKDKNGNSDGVLRCKDFLSSYELDLYGGNNKNIALYGEFDHAFSELIIMRGKGFDSPPEGKERITAVLSKPITHIKVNVDATDGWKCTPELTFNLSNQSRLSEDDARKWNAWKGGNFGITTEDKVGKEAWYIIVPTLGSQVGKKRAGERSIVDYIELYDNEGNLLQVKSLQLSGGNTKYVDAAWRYPMVITMEELVPTINPFPIVPWDKNDVDLTDERKRGISNTDEFAKWIRAYNTYLAEPMREENINNLLPYGDTSVDDDGSNRKWHFYILSDLDLSGYRPADDDEAKSMNVTISKLKDVLDGTSTTFVNGKFINHKIKGLSRTFVGNLENGSVQNLDFIEPEIRNDENSTTSTGIIANTMKDASVSNCKIDDGTLYNPGGPAGMVAGTMDGGEIKNCTISGFLIANSTTSSKLIGVETGNVTLTGNNINVTDMGETEP